jgi:TetR/AcrR family transcriptional regulator, fatty acid metabolism regulator protein
VAATEIQRDKRRQILRAAITVFARTGYHGSRVSDVAKEAGVAYGLVYHYFGSKEDLLEAVFRRTWSRMLEAVQEIERTEETARGQIAGVARIVLGAWEVDPDLVRVLVREVARSPQLGREVDEIAHAFEALERIVRGGQERGELRTDVEPRLAAWILYGALEEILTGWVFAVVALLLDGLAAD